MEKRIYPKNEIESLDFKKIENDSFLSTWFLSYCLLVSSAENFIVRSASKAMKKINNAKLSSELRLCFFQEAQHAKGHEEFNKLYFKHNSMIKRFIAFSHFMNYQLIEGIAPIQLKISAASAMEQLNAEIAYFGLTHQDQLPAHLPFKSLLNWHFIEEIEHRDCLYDLMNELNISYFTKFLGMIIVLFSFSFWITSLSVLLFLTKKSSIHKAHLVFGPQGILLRFIKSSLQYLKKGYHPRNENIPGLFEPIKITISGLRQ